MAIEVRHMPKEYINPKELFPSLQYGFSQVVTCCGGKMVFVSGQVGWNEQQQMVGPNDLRAQTWQTFRNIEKAMQAAGGTLEDVVSMRIYIVEEQLEESHCVTEALKEFFPSAAAPTTTWIGVRALANNEFLIEIEALGVIEPEPNEEHESTQ
jgi:2-iminobutanoate/2-iminopropanoate deaminase